MRGILLVVASVLIIFGLGFAVTISRVHAHDHRVVVAPKILQRVGIHRYHAAGFYIDWNLIELETISHGLPTFDELA